MKEGEIERLQEEYIIPCMPSRIPITIAEGEGCYVKDLRGKEYLDCFAGIAVANMGHCHPKNVEAIQNQAKKLHHCSSLYYSIPMAELAEEIARITPDGLKKSFFCNSGAEAVEGAIKLAKKYAYSNGRLGTEVISVDCSFHGRTSLTLSLTGQNKYKQGLGTFANAMGVLHAPVPYCYRCPLGLEYPGCDVKCAKVLEDIIERRTTDDVAAFIIEPVLGEGGIIVPPEEYPSEARDICNNHEVLFVADEVQSGLGRCGKMFAVDDWEFAPDVMTLAKGIASGMPLADIVARDEVAEAFEEGDHFSTYGGNPLTCAAGLANINAMQEEGIPQKAKETGEYLLDGLKKLAESYDIIGDIRGKGLMIGVELVKDREKKAPGSEETSEIRERAREQGVLIGAGGVKKNVLRIQPPLVISKDQIDDLLQVLDESFQKL